MVRGVLWRVEVSSGEPADIFDGELDFLDDFLDFAYALISGSLTALLSEPKMLTLLFLFDRDDGDCMRVPLLGAFRIEGFFE